MNQVEKSLDERTGRTGGQGSATPSAVGPANSWTVDGGRVFQRDIGEGVRINTYTDIRIYEYIDS